MAVADGRPQLLVEQDAVGPAASSVVVETALLVRLPVGAWLPVIVPPLSMSRSRSGPCAMRRFLVGSSSGAIVARDRRAARHCPLRARACAGGEPFPRWGWLGLAWTAARWVVA